LALDGPVFEENTMPANRTPRVPEKRATFTFKGTVKQVRAATLRQVSADERTLIVTVDHIIEAPVALAAFTGHDITVQTTRGARPRVGDEFIFHTTGWMFGDSVAVQSIQQLPVNKSHTALVSRGGDPIDHKRARDRRERFDQASLVVSGTVTTVRLPAEAVTSKRRAVRVAGLVVPAAVGPVSEHDPHWREAVIAVDDVHKGRGAKREVVIRFPASTDVRWYKAPKFQTGQKGFFMLHDTQVTTRARRVGGAARARAAGPPEIERSKRVYTALSPMDFQTYQEPGGIRTVLETRPRSAGT
jgi:hypothetical protein